MKATREGFGDEILVMGKENKGICVIDCDISKSCKTDAFMYALLEQHINVGIAEQNAAGIATRKLVRKTAEFVGPLYIRFTRDAMPDVYGVEEEFEIGVAKQLRDGKDIAIIANGDTVRLGVEACALLEKEGHLCPPAGYAYH